MLPAMDTSGTHPLAFLAILVGVLVFAAESGRSDYSTRAEVVDYVKELVAEHAFDREWLLDVFEGAEKSDEVIGKIDAPAEKKLAWHEYRRIFLTEQRIDGGVEFIRTHRNALDAATDTYGVPVEMIAAIIGVETFYGRYLGSHRVIDSLATLAFDYPRRSEFFKAELTQFLLLVREEEKDPFEPMGSYAGAMGYGQFISSSYRNYAVDFDGDGLRDIWTNKTDAIGSVANYFARHGWKGEVPPAVRVEIRDDRVLELADDAGLELAHTVGDLRKRGAVVPNSIGDAEKAALFTMELAQGKEYWLARHDFYVITRYNRSALYALAVLQLSDAIRSALENGQHE
ncbi:MAG: lytic murein transglycosylase B [Gammaproteobacteria bacterium]|nr:lytic murein transglycosylase B [Gammaproteobacteria bacterium]